MLYHFKVVYNQHYFKNPVSNILTLYLICLSLYLYILNFLKI